MTRIRSASILIFLFVSLVAHSQFTDSRDGKTYGTTAIGPLIWMTENLKFSDAGEGSSCFGKNPYNMSSYGVLYNWNTAIKACPEGWRLPTGEEFRSLLGHLENEVPADRPASGPNVYPIQLAGMQDHEGTFTEMDESGYYWTSTEYNEAEAEYFSYMIINGHPVFDISRREDMPDIHGAEKTSKYSVRCVKEKDGKN